MGYEKIQEFEGLLEAPTMRAAPFTGRADSDAIIGGENLGQYTERQLQYVTAKLYEAKIPELSSLILIETDREIPEGVESYIDRIYATSGDPAWVSDGATDIPVMEVYGSETARVIHTFAGAYQYSIRDIANQRVTGTDISSRKAENVRNRMARFHAKVAWLGKKELGLDGALTYSTIPRIKTDINFASDDAADIEDTVHGWANAVSEDSEGVESGTMTLVLPRAKYNVLQTRRYGADSPDTLSTVILRNSSYIDRIAPADEFKGVLKGGKDAGFLTPTKDEDAIRYVMPVAFKNVMPQLDGLMWKFPAYAQSGGVACRAPRRNRVIEFSA